MELQQSPLYANYIQSLHWNVESIDTVNVFIKPFPLIGSFVKIQRISTLPNIQKLLPVLKKYRAKWLVLEAGADMDENKFQSFAHALKRHVRILTTPYIPTKTIRVDLKPPKEEIFQRFSQAKRRAVRRAIKNGVLIKTSNDIHTLIKVKNTSAGVFGFITTRGLQHMWQAFEPDHTSIVLAFHDNTPVAGIFLVFWERVAYYWIAGATKKGKRLAAPTLATWEAIQLAKAKGAQWFDFLGVWDERFPNSNKDWLGFTKFKEGFGGVPLYYPTHYTGK
jgi:lipid II:glycine glycyltransferase (peptidoglycan interpeptide bridge formation enzyme)